MKEAALLVITAYDCHPFQLAGHGYVQDRIKDRMSTPGGDWWSLFLDKATG